MVRSVRQWKALFGLLSALAVVGPAAGLAYLGVKANRAERDRARQGLDDRHRNEAHVIATAIGDEARRTLDAIARAFAAPSGPPAPEALAGEIAGRPLARAAFRLDASGRLVWPVSDVAGRAPDPESDRHARRVFQGPDRNFEDYVDDLRAERRLARRLDEARAAEASAGGAAIARRAYRAVARAQGQPAAEALLGLARLDLAAGRPTDAAARYAELARRFGPLRDGEGISYELLADLGTALATRQAADGLRAYRRLLAGDVAAPPGAVLALATEARTHLAGLRLTANDDAELRALDRRADEARASAAFAESLAGDAAFLATTALGEPQARASAADPGRVLVYRRHFDGGAVGFAVDGRWLTDAAASAAARERRAGSLPLATAVWILAGDAAGDERPAVLSGDVLAREPLGLMPTVSVALVGDAGAADRAARAGLVRYLALVGGLIAVLLVGVVATWRGAARARELSSLKSDFVSSVSHELRTPLTSIRMYGEMLREGIAADDPDRVRHYHEVIVSESERLSRLIANVLDFSQIERGARRYDRKAAPVGALVDEAVETFRRMAGGEAHPVTIEADGGARAARILADREAIVQSILNLLSNAAKYGGDHPITVALAAAARECRISVVDRGPGIEARERRRLFREFYRTPGARRSGVEGTGLGLALVKHHAEAHDGRVLVESAVGKGSTFTIVIPRLRQEGTSA